MLRDEFPSRAHQHKLDVFIAEVVYYYHNPFNTFDLSNAHADTKEDMYKYMIAWDLNSIFWFDWHKEAPFNLTIEHTGTFIPDNDDLQFAIYNEELEQWAPSFGINLSTSWDYAKWNTGLIVAYSPKTESGLLMPNVSVTPDVLNRQLSFQLQYFRVFGESNYTGLGMMQQKDMVLLTTQLNF